MNCALFGGGRIASYFHLPVLLSLAGVQLTDIVEPDRQRWPELATASSARLHESCETLAGPLHAAVICAPTSQHFPLATEAWRRGLRVYLEKPLALDELEARAMLDLQEQAGTSTMVGFNQRFRPAHIKARSWLPRLGPLVGGIGSMGVPGELVQGWRRQRASGGGALLELACHHLDLLGWLLGEPIVAARATLTSDLHQDDRASIWLKMRGGFEFSGLYTLCSAETDQFEIFGERGRLSCQRGLPWPRPQGLYPPRTKAEGLKAFGWGLAASALQLNPPAETSYRSALQCFFDCLQRGDRPQPDLRHGLWIQIVLGALERSARQGGCIIELSDEWWPGPDDLPARGRTGRS